MLSRRKSSRPRYRVLDGKTSVELKLREPRQLFDERDPAPFRERDLDDDAVRYILNSYRELEPSHRDVKLSLYFETLGEISDNPRVIERAIHGFFRFEAEVKKRELRDLLRTGLISLCIGLTFLTMCIWFSHHFGGTASFSKSLVKEGLQLMGWVSMWKPINIFLYEWWPIRGALSEFRRLSVIEVEIRDLKPESLKPVVEVARPTITLPSTSAGVALPLGAAIPSA